MQANQSKASSFKIKWWWWWRRWKQQVPADSKILPAQTTITWQTGLIITGTRSHLSLITLLIYLITH